MELIQQRTDHDCAICTIAMAVNYTYEEVMEKALAKEDTFHPEKGCYSEHAILEGLGLKQVADFRIMHRGGSSAILSADFFRQFSWGRRAILAVPSLNIPDGWHSVYWNGTKLFDPCQRKTYSAWAELQPNELIIFAECGSVV